ncbi:MAG: penicillin-binding protein [Nocardioides sp.]|nr:penicillin-binding protein [Nocardioides sp.]
MVRTRVPQLLSVLALTGAVLLAGCTEVKDAVAGPDPEPTATAFVEALAAQDLTGAPVTDPRAAEDARAEIVDAMGGVTPQVGLLDLDESGDTATATLQWRWPLVTSGTAADWTYEAPLRLEREGDGWVAVWAPSVVEPSLVEGETLDLTTLTPRRGDIVGARGLAVVTQRPVNRIGIDKTLVGQSRALADARKLAQAVGIDAAGFVERVEAAGDAAFVEAIVLRVEDVSSPMSMAISRLKGARRIGAEIPLAPSRGFAAPILGSVGQVTAEMVEEDPDTYRPGDVAGLSGLQARYDDQLRGTPGASVDVVPAEGSGEEVREVFRVEPEKGSTLKISLDVDLQAEAEAVLRRTGPASALVAIDPGTGAVLAAANGPGTGGTNLATYGQAAPGSTFKTVSSLALLRAGLDPTSSVQCPATTVVDGKTFGNYSDYPSGATGRITLRQAVANSCNTAFITSRGRIRGTGLYDAAASLGFGIDHDLGFPAYFGQVPQPETETEAAADLIGQGRVLASPMVMATVVASVQAGETVVPWLVKDYRDGPPEGAKPLTGGEASALRSMLRAVVTDGSGRGLLDVPGPELIAKTGTA